MLTSHTRNALSAGYCGARTGSRRERRRGAEDPLLLVQPADHLQPRRHILYAARRLPPPQSAGRNAVLSLCVQSLRLSSRRLPRRRRSCGAKATWRRRSGCAAAAAAGASAAILVPPTETAVLTKQTA